MLIYYAMTHKSCNLDQACIAPEAFCGFENVLKCICNLGPQWGIQ